jgi:hypothetical protein
MEKATWLLPDSYPILQHSITPLLPFTLRLKIGSFGQVSLFPMTDDYLSDFNPGGS